MTPSSLLGFISLPSLCLSVSPRFLGKCSDFFYWFVNSHLKRVEFNPNFPVLEFLTLFYKYTFKQVTSPTTSHTESPSLLSPSLQPGVDNFCVCLGTWGVFLDHLIMMSSGIHGGQSPPNNNHYERCPPISINYLIFFFFCVVGIGRCW